VKRLAIWRLFQAAAIAALLQGIAVTAATLLLVTYAHHQIEGLHVRAGDPAIQSLVPLLQLTYLVAAIGLAATRHRFVDSTAERIRRLSDEINRADPDRAASMMMIALWFAAMGFAALALLSPPPSLTEQGWHLGYIQAAPAIWSGMMSIGVASFGASAHAAALKR